MGSDMQNLLFTLLIIGASITAFVLAVVFIAVPLFRGIGSVIGYTFRGIGWFFTHIFEFIGGILSDVVRFIGSLLAMIVLLPMVPLNVIFGRWSAAGHFASGVKRECHVGSLCVYRALIRRPLRLLLLDGLLEGIEQRVPEAMHGAPGSDSPSRRVGQFDGYTILGSLRAGGSGAKLYVAQPTPDKQRKFRGRALPDRVVIKSFALTEGSSLPQIVRESRALECAKQLGHVLDHGMDEHRFFYVMPYHPGDHLGILTRQMHGECGGRGLDQNRLDRVMSYTHDLLATLSAYHKGGLWHKDVKPENVIVHDGQAHLVDLGLVTPLRSAMTLTTHGTEYFRDPEMVRQALRGVKVHQVDGAKFDIYAVGAVLYFMIENTFPAHGGLSRFVANSPEALRWIVRRAMTEYNQRYETADEMLADLDYVARAPDAFAVKPAELPSMRGAESPEPCTPEVHVVNASGLSDAEEVEALKGVHARVVATGGSGGRAFSGFAGIAIGKTGFGIGRFNINKTGKAAAADATAGSAPGANPAASGAAANSAAANPSGRPKLNITNWWTGHYRVESPGEPGQAPNQNFSDDARTFRQQAFAFRQQARDIGRQARAGAISARAAAREQIKAARQRAREIRTRALAHRHRVVVKKNTSPIVVLITLALIGSILALTFGAMFTLRQVRSGSAMNVASVVNNGRPVVLLAVDAGGPITDSARREIDRLVKQYRSSGYDVVTDHSSPDDQLIALLRNWDRDSQGPADDGIEDMLEANNAYGIVRITVENGRKGRQVVRGGLIQSTRPGASDRRRFAVPEVPPPPSQPYLLVNDHPAKADLNVIAEIERQLKAYRDRGWEIVTNDDVEVQVRKLGAPDPKSPPPVALRTILSNGKLGGVMRIDGKAGNEPIQQRVVITRIDLDSIPAPTNSVVDSSDVPAAATANSG